MRRLVLLGAMVRKNNRGKIYEPLTDSLRKIQWVRFAGLRSITIEQKISKQTEPNKMIMFPLEQIDHALSITDCLIHGKSALDSIAVFLTSLLNLDVEGGDRDFKKSDFRHKIEERDPILWKEIRRLEPWISELQEMRDEWIHRSVYRSLLVSGPTPVGILPIPKNIRPGLKAFEFELTDRNFWTTEGFVTHLYDSLVHIFRAVIERCLQIELSLFEKLEELPEIPAPAEEQMIMFPVWVTQKMTVKGTILKIPNITEYLDP